jgi:hypothetical protein
MQPHELARQQAEAEAGVEGAGENA